jgi:hypothetical protein
VLSHVRPAPTPHALAHTKCNSLHPRPQDRSLGLHIFETARALLGRQLVRILLVFASVAVASVGAGTVILPSVAGPTVDELRAWSVAADLGEPSCGGFAGFLECNASRRVDGGTVGYHAIAQRTSSLDPRDHDELRGDWIKLTLDGRSPASQAALASVVADFGERALHKPVCKELDDALRAPAVGATERERFCGAAFVVRREPTRIVVFLNARFDGATDPPAELSW